MNTKAPWGEHEVLYEDPNCKVKRLAVNPGQRLSLQRHSLRSERWTVVSGYGEAEVNRTSMNLMAGDTVTVGCGDVHRLRCTSSVPLIVIEVQLGDCKELDIERLKDDYGRAR